MKKIFLLMMMLIVVSPILTHAATENKANTKSPMFKVPPTVLQITKENTYPNPSQDLPFLQPSELTQQLVKSSNVKIENPELIRILNETTIAKAPFALGYRATIYLGHWALHYESAETSPNWEYQKINTNFHDNRGTRVPYPMHYVQELQKVVRGGLTAKIPAAKDVQKMMLLKAAEKSKLPLSFETIIGAGTKNERIYNIPSGRIGYLYAYASAVNEKGKVTYGEVYLVLKGNKKTIVVKNVTSQGIGAWIPIQDYISFSFMASERPR